MGLKIELGVVWEWPRYVKCFKLFKKFIFLNFMGNRQTPGNIWPYLSISWILVIFCSFWLFEDAQVSLVWRIMHYCYFFYVHFVEDTFSFHLKKNHPIWIKIELCGHDWSLSVFLFLLLLLPKMLFFSFLKKLTKNLVKM